MSVQGQDEETAFLSFPLQMPWSQTSQFQAGLLAWTSQGWVCPYCSSDLGHKLAEKQVAFQQSEGRREYQVGIKGDTHPACHDSRLDRHSG